ncbi:hypothetical protein [Vibrio neptunius]|uniref:hypothetical protein n=1 Tax=Vibrio neptunius TaxID=170651 RepID=UPI0019D183F5|nr:hypothetical protein [Vibrio neptunius]MBN3573675.1 hypothetical protein [Vibrio neptunius]
MNKLDLRDVRGYLGENYRLEELSPPFNNYIYIRNEDDCGVLSKVENGKAKAVNLDDGSIVSLCGDVSYFGKIISLSDKPMGFNGRIEYSFKLNKKKIKLDNMYISDDLGNYYSIKNNKEIMVSYDEDPRERKLIGVKSKSERTWLYDIKVDENEEITVTKLKEISIKENEDIIITGAIEEYMESEFFVFYKLESDRFQGYVLESDIALN